MSVASVASVVRSMRNVASYRHPVCSVRGHEH